jgi:DNA-binding MarR family transcriptional regulator
MGTHLTSPQAAAGESDIQSVLDSIRRIVGVLRVASRAAEKSVGLTGAQLFVLQKLAEEDGLSLGELSRRTRTHQSSVSVVVKRLIEMGLVRRAYARADGRRLVLSLAAPARTRLRKAPGAAQDQLIEALGNMPASRRRELAQRLLELVEHLGIDEESPEMFFVDGQSNSRKGGGSEDAREESRHG